MNWFVVIGCFVVLIGEAFELEGTEKTIDGPKMSRCVCVIPEKTIWNICDVLWLAVDTYSEQEVGLLDILRFLIVKMGGGSVVEDWVPTPSANKTLNLVFVGRTGNGKSASGNSILGKKKAFISRSSSAGVTIICEQLSTLVGDGTCVNVIDTPPGKQNNVGGKMEG
ncbi:hypothetical protein QQ045_019036 [Rhodiola kirilowii]